jgi:hypothetical protein
VRRNDTTNHYINSSFEVSKVDALEHAAKAAYERQVEIALSEGVFGNLEFPPWEDAGPIAQKCWMETIKAALTQLQPSDILEIKEAMI